MRAAALVTALLMLTAGCIGTSGDDADTSTDETDDPASDSDASTGSDSTTDADNESHGHDPQPEPHWDNRTGEVSGENVVVTSRGNATEEKLLPATAREFEIVLTAEGGEIDGEVYPPDCTEDGDDTQGASCSTDLSTCSGTACAQADGGTAEFTASSINPGNWTVAMQKADPGASAVSYTLTFYYVDVHEPAPGHHDS